MTVKTSHDWLRSICSTGTPEAIGTPQELGTPEASGVPQGAVSRSSTWSNWRRSSCLVLLGTLFCCTLFFCPSLAAQDTEPVGGSVAKLTEAIDQAEASFKASNFAESAQHINDAIAELEKVLEATRKEEVGEIRKQHRRISVAQRLLRSQRQTTEKIPRLKFNYIKEEEKKEENPSTGEMSTERVSFTQTVAPILAEKCGRCHISRRSGDVSLASISQMVELIEAGDSAGSQLYAVIEDGSMPKGNIKMTDDEKLAVKTWIDQGAKLDGTDPNFDLRPLLQNQPRNTGPAPTITQATDQDSVFFSRDIAPMLAETCTGCHINATRVRGGLNMDTFAQMARGGDSGALWVPGKPEESLIVHKLKGMGDGQRMPINRPAWSKEQIDKISTWIAEGAHYDSPDARTPVGQLVNLSKIMAMDASQLKEHRTAVADQQWELALVGVRSEKSDSDHFHFVVGYGVKSELQKEIQKTAETMYEDFSRQLLGPEAPATAQAPITVFIPKSGYDYSEFGKMVENREVDLQEKFHWSRTVDGPYLVFNGNLKVEQVEEAMKQVLPAAMVATWQPNLPKWFCDSVGSSVVEWRADQLQTVGTYFANNPPTNQQTQQWMGDRLVTHQPFDIVAGMGWRKSRGDLKRLRDQLWQQKPLTAAFTEVLQAPPNQVGAQLLKIGMQ